MNCHLPLPSPDFSLPLLPSCVLPVRENVWICQGGRGPQAPLVRNSRAESLSDTEYLLLPPCGPVEKEEEDEEEEKEKENNSEKR